jgi:hypothetical protein
MALKLGCRGSRDVAALERPLCRRNADGALGEHRLAMKAIVAAVRRRVPAPLIEHGLYAAILGLASHVVLVLERYWEITGGPVVESVVKALWTAGVALRLLPLAVGAAPLIDRGWGDNGIFVQIVLAAKLMAMFVLWLTLPAAATYRLMQRACVVLRPAGPHAGGGSAPPFALLVLLWSVASSLCALGLAAAYGLIMAGFFHRQGYFHEAEAAEMLWHSALPLAVMPLVLMVLRRLASAAWRRVRS